MPEPTREFVRAVSESSRCDPSYVALPLLAVLASAVGNSRRIQLRRGWTEPACLWTVSIGESGTGKSIGWEHATRPLVRLQAEHLQDHQQGTREPAEVPIGSGVPDAVEELLEPKTRPKPGDAPLGFDVPRRWLTSDTTIAALAGLLSHNPRGLLVSRDELAGWFAGFSRNARGSSGSQVAHWLELHGGRALIVDRKGRTVYLPAALVSVCGTIQPGTLARALGREHRENGLLPRLLLAWPPPRRKRWSESDIQPEAMREIDRLVRSLLALEMPTSRQGEPRPVVLELSTDAKQRWVDFYNDHAEEQEAMSADLRAHWSKLEAYAARLALLVHAVRQVSQDRSLRYGHTIDRASVETAVELVRWFGDEARRVYALLGGSARDRELHQRVEVLWALGGSVTVRDWQRKRFLRTADGARRELQELVDLGLGELEWARPGPGRPSQRFVLAEPD